MSQTDSNGMLIGMLVLYVGLMTGMYVTMRRGSPQTVYGIGDSITASPTNLQLIKSLSECEHTPGTIGYALARYYQARDLDVVAMCMYLAARDTPLTLPDYVGLARQPRPTNPDALRNLCRKSAIVPTRLAAILSETA